MSIVMPSRARSRITSSTSATSSGSRALVTSSSSSRSGFVVAGVLFIFLTIPLARFTDHLVRERELRERALAV